MSRSESNVEPEERQIKQHNHTQATTDALKTTEAPKANKWGVLAATLIGAFTVILNNSLMNVALPHFMEIYNLTAVQGQWVVTGFALAMAISMPLTGYLGKIMGRKNVYLLGVALFLIGSILGAFSWSFEVIIAFRLVQGLGGGLIMPLAMVLIFQHFPKNERGLAMGIWGVAAMIAPTIGPTLGGVILNFSDWPTLFLMNVPTALLAGAASWYFLSSHDKREKIPFDWPGFALISIGLISLMIGIDQMQNDNANWLIISLISIGIIALIAFVRVELRVSSPLLDLRIFGNVVYTGSLVLVSASTTAMFSVLLLMPLLVQDVLGHSPLLTGLLLFPQALVMGLSMTLGGRILDKKGPFLVILSGMAILTIVTFVLGSVVGHISIWLLVLLLMLHGFGNGFINTPSTTAGMNALQESQIPAGSALNNVLRQLMKVIAVVFVSMFFEWRRGVYMTEMPAQEAGIIAIQHSYYLIALILLCTIPLILTLRKKW